MDKNSSDFLYLVSKAVNGLAADRDRVSGMDLAAVYAIAEWHRMAACVSFALEPCPPQFRQARELSVRRTALFDAERAAIFSFLDGRGIWYLPLKGTVLKDLYPRYGMREMVDNDVLYDDSRRQELYDFMISRGYAELSRGLGVHDEYTREPVYNFEFHRGLFSDRLEGGVFHEYYADIGRRLVPTGDGSAMRLSDSDLYIYVTAHAYKHYTEGGTGIRTLADSYLMRRRLDINWDYVLAEAEKLGMGDFEARHRGLSDGIFTDPDNIVITDQELLEYLLESGASGSVRHHVDNELKRLSPDGSVGTGTRLRYVLRRIFPSFDEMRHWSPAGMKYPFLIPLLYIWRILRMPFRSLDRASAELEYLGGKRPVLWAVTLALVLAVMAAIWGFSAQPARESSETSGRLTRAVISVTVPEYDSLPAREQTGIYEQVQHIVRKLAHLTEYAALGLFLALHVRVVASKRGAAFVAAVSLAAGAAYAVLDEWHQSFVDGRGPGLADVLIDSAGVLMGAAVALSIVYIVTKIRRGKRTL